MEALPVPVLGNVSDQDVAEVEGAGGWLQYKLTRLGPCSPRGMSHLPSAERRGSTGELSSVDQSKVLPGGSSVTRKGPVLGCTS